MSTPAAQQQWTLKDFASDQDVRWCPGCGDYSILAAVRKVLAEAGVPPEQYAFVSGIGCSSRFPYYMNTYGLHGIHGRALAIATGLRVARPDVITYVVTGDGDGLSIGGNHTLHCLRRNVNVKILLFNNQIYGLTKGQYSPTSPMGQKTKSTPMGSIDRPIQPLSIALAAEATFVARAVDLHPKLLQDVIRRAHEHRGAAFVEIYQNCNIFNDGALAYAQDRKIRADNIVELEHGRPMIFGQNRDKGIILRDGRLQAVRIGENGIGVEDLLVHDEQADVGRHFLLARMKYPDLPEPVGVLRAVERPVYEDLVNDQIEKAVAVKGKGDLQKLLRGSATWTVQP
ncbi:MAG: 2-oxoacid:ferredoxin oxidoreductase subunit beta [Candidatus Sumerlaeia bacterium]